MKKTKFALLQSVICLLLCMSMLIGTTFAWFTDSVTSGNNIIAAGNLDIELEYLDGSTWKKVNESTNVFKNDTLWEPGHTEVVYLKVSNAGTLALKYQLGVNIAKEVGSVNQAGDDFLLSDYIYFGTVEGVSQAYADRAAARAAVTAAEKISTGYSKTGTMEKGAAPQYVALVVYMPEETGNAANYATGATPPSIDLGIFLTATQMAAETDSFGADYDVDASAGFFPGFMGGSATTSVTRNDQGETAAEVSMHGGNVSAVVPANVLLDGNSTELELSVTEKDASEANVQLGDSQLVRPLDVHIKGVAAGNTVPMLITLEKCLPKGMNPGSIKLYHVENGQTIEMTLVDNPVNHNEFSYDPLTGITVLAMATFSEVALVADANNPWDGTIAKDFAGGNGDEATPYLIATAPQLAYFRTQVDNGNSFAGKFVKLANNIHLSGGKNFDPIGWGYENKDWNAGDVAGKPFKGTFDGGNNIIFGLHQNGWDLESETGTDYTYTNCGFGLFGAVYNGTIKNLTISGADIVVECVETGVLVGLSQGNCTYENIRIYGCSIANYQRPTGGVVGEVSPDVSANKGLHTFRNIIVDNKTTVGSLWGDFDAPLGGVIGAYWDDTNTTQVVMEDCHIGCVIDAYSDVTSAYQWYAYRRAGMLIGNTDHATTEASGRNVATAPFLECKTDSNGNPTVHIYYGKWIDYHYCRFTNQDNQWCNNYPWVRVEEGRNCSAYSNPRYGCPVVGGTTVTNDNHQRIHGDEDKDSHYISIPFGQLYGGGQGIYGGGQQTITHDGALPEYKATHPGVIIEGFDYIITMENGEGYVVNLAVITDGQEAPDFNGKDFGRYQLASVKNRAFAGWVDKDGNRVTKETFASGEDVTIYATWSDCTVTYMVRGEIYAVVGKKIGDLYTVGSDVTKLADRTENGRIYTFKSWVNAAGITVDTITIEESIVVYDSWNGIYTARFVDQLGNLVQEVEFVEGTKTLTEPSTDLVDLHQTDVTVAWESYTLGNADIVIRPVYTYNGNLKLVPIDNEPKDGRTDYYQVEAVSELPNPVTVPGYIGDLKVSTIKKLTDKSFASNVKTIVIEDGVERLEENALAGTDKLETVELPKSIQYLGKNVFSNNVLGMAFKEITIYYDGTMEEFKAIPKDGEWHNGLDSGTKVICTDGVGTLKRTYYVFGSSYSWSWAAN